jgi:hypothetical protein
MPTINEDGIQIWFDDLSTKAQDQYLKFHNVDSKDELKLDKYPILVEEEPKKE